MNINEINYAIRFVFNCSDNWGFATDDVGMLKKLKDESNIHPVDRFIVGDIIHISREDIGDTIKCKVAKIDVRDIRLTTEEPLLGSYQDDRETFTNKEGKFILISIFVNLEIINE